MGMYDYLKCEYPLPRPEMQDRIFQTKDTPSQFLDIYVITAEGKLCEPSYDLGWKEDPEAFFGFGFERENHELRELDFSGTIIFYDFEVDGDFATLVDFEALFDRGKVVWIREIGSD